MNSFSRITLAVLAAWPAVGQVTSLKGPVSGFIFDTPSGSVRPVLGVPGSSYLGQPVLQDLRNAFIAPDGESALVVTSGQPARVAPKCLKSRVPMRLAMLPMEPGCPGPTSRTEFPVPAVQLVKGLRSDSPAVFPLPELGGQVDFVSWASDSASLVAYCSATHVLLRLDADASGPRFSWRIDLSYLEGEVTEVATNGDATQTVFSLRHPTQGGFYVLLGSASPFRFYATSQAGTTVFGSQGVLYAIDKEKVQVLRFSGDAYSGFESLLAPSSESQPITDPVALALSRDGRSLYVAGGADQGLREFDLTSRELLREIRLPVAPRRFLPMANTSFVLDSQRDGAQPVWLLNTLGAPSISFVPAGEVVAQPESANRTR